MSNGTKGELTELWRETVADSSIYGLVGDVYGIGDLAASREVSDKSPYGAATPKKRKEVTGRVDEGNQEFVVRYKKGNALAQAMVDDFYAPAQVDRTFQLRLADAEKSLIVTQSQISALTQTFPDGDYIELKFTLDHNDVDRSGTWT